MACTITIHNEKNIHEEQLFLEAVIMRMICNTESTSTINIYAAKRKESGWIQWDCELVYKTGSFLFIAAIQRKAGAEIEFCS